MDNIDAWLEGFSSVPELNSDKFYLKDVTLKILNKIRLPEEKMIHTLPEFHYVPSGWFPVYIKTQMKHSKQLEDINLPWMGYFYLGNREEESCSSRFNPESPYYQAWFGVYLIKNQPLNKKEYIPFGFSKGYPDFDVLIRAGIGDQRSWLMKYRVSNPICKTMRMGLEDPVLFSIQNKIGFIWTGSILTHSDLNINGSRDWRYNRIFGKPKKRFFDIVDERHFVILDGFYICGFDKFSKITWIIYGVASRFQTKTGVLVSNYPKIKAEMIAMAAQVRIVPTM